MSRGFEDDKTKSIQTIEQMIETAVNSAVNTLQAKINKYWETVYPVGSIYIASSQLNNPARLFGGEWERYASGRFLIGGSAGTETSMSQGGHSKQTINIDYQHRHDVLYPDTNDLIFAHGQHDPQSSNHQFILSAEIPATSQDVENGKLQLVPVSSASGRYQTDAQGTRVNSEVTIDITPPYQRVYFWRRVS